MAARAQVARSVLSDSGVVAIAPVSIAAPQPS